MALGRYTQQEVTTSAHDVIPQTSNLGVHSPHSSSTAQMPQQSRLAESSQGQQPAGWQPGEHLA